MMGPRYPIRTYSKGLRSASWTDGLPDWASLPFYAGAAAVAEAQWIGRYQTEPCHSPGRGQVQLESHRDADVTLLMSTAFSTTYFWAMML